MKFFKRRRSAGKAVDAVAEIESRQAHFEERGLPDLHGSARPAAPGAKAFFYLLFMMAMMILSTLAWRWVNNADAPSPGSQAEPQARIENILPRLKLRESPAASPPPAQTVEPPADTAPSPKPTGRLGDLVDVVVEDPVITRRLSSGLQAKEQDGEGGARGEPPKQASRAGDSGPMAERLTPMKLTAAQAELLPDRDMLITQGTMIDCVQDTMLVSAQAGMITCFAPHDVRSTSGRVALIDAGTKFVGYQQGVLAQGQPRIGVVWSRLETPNGVVIHLDSPGTGPLGEAGLDGHIDTHFGERFGGAVLVSLISDFGSWASSRGNDSGDSIRFDSTGDAAQDAVSTVLDNSINIPPTLYRNQGGRIGIYVARDLDFSSVYTLRPVPR